MSVCKRPIGKVHPTHVQKDPAVITPLTGPKYGETLSTLHVSARFSVSACLRFVLDIKRKDRSSRLKVTKMKKMKEMKIPSAVLFTKIHGRHIKAKTGDRDTPWPRLSGLYSCGTESWSGLHELWKEDINLMQPGSGLDCVRVGISSFYIYISEAKRRLRTSV